jgi:predicted Zn finger-like uncharacterized protein
VYTLCPQCQTVFRVTAAQLKARDGQVRCGRCQHVFRADQHLIERPPEGTTRPKTATRKRVPRKSARPAAGIETTSPSPVAVAEPVRDTAGDSTPWPHTRATRTQSVYWSVGALALLLVLLGQVVVFYGTELVRAAPLLRTTVSQLCRTLPCQRLAPTDMHRLDLVETQVTPHPRYDRALRVKATVVNRAERAQPYPLLEVTLIDSQGNVVARRAYPPREYLRKPETIAAGLPPQVAVSAQLDITSPGPQANGFEILLLPPSE